MITVTFGDALGDFGQVSSFYNLLTLKLTHNSTKLITYDAPDGAEVSFYGSSLHETKNIISSGKVDHIVFHDSDGHLLLSVATDPKTTKDDFDVKALATALKQGGIESMLEKAFSGNDTFNGSAHADYILGGGGNDVLNGKGGADWLIGNEGKDTLTGGTGNDVFFLGKGYGHDTVTDFDKHGEHDMISIQNGRSYSATYDKATHTETIDYGHGDIFTVEHLTHKLVASDFERWG